MSDLIDRYVHHVGRHLPKAERADVEDELQSLIEEQLADRHGPAPTAAEITALLHELGDPWRMAASYNADRYLIGAELYPPTVSVLRYGWLVVPAVTSFVSLLSSATAPPPFVLADVVVRTIAAVAILTAAFTGVVVIVAALIERALREGRLRAPAFDPAALPAIDDPLAVERAEMIFTIVFGAFWTLLFAYFLAVGGLTLRFDLSPPPDLIPAPRAWLGAVIGIALIVNGLMLWALRRGRWTPMLWAAQMLLSAFGLIALYFAVIAPLYGRLAEVVPALGDLAFSDAIPVALTIGLALLSFTNEGVRLIRMMSSRAAAPQSHATSHQ